MSKKVYGRLSTDPDRLRLLEAVAKAAKPGARFWVDITLGEGVSFSECVSNSKYDRRITDYRRPVLEALAALEALDDGREP